MKLRKVGKESNLTILNFALCISIILIYSCNNAGSGGSGGTGSIVFNLEMLNTSNFVPIDLQQAQVNCAESLIDTVAAEVYDENEDLLAEGGPWDCDLGEGTITDVEAGSQRTVMVTATGEGGIPLFTGQSEPVTVTAGEKTNAGTIFLELIDTISVTFDFEELPPTYVDIGGGDPRPGVLTGLASEKSRIRIVVFREGNVEFDLVDNTAGFQIIKPLVEYGAVSLDPFFDFSDSAFIVNFSVPVSSVSVAMGDYNTRIGAPEQDNDVLTLEAYSLANATGTLLDNDQIDLPDTPAEVNSFSFETLFVATAGECIRSILMIGGSEGIGPNSVFYDSIVVEAPCVPLNQGQINEVNLSATSQRPRGNLDSESNASTKEAGGYAIFDGP